MVVSEDSGLSTIIRKEHQKSIRECQGMYNGGQQMQNASKESSHLTKGMAFVPPP